MDERQAQGRAFPREDPDRDCFTGILVRLVTGCSWDVAARLTPVEETTVRERRTEWLKAGVFDKLVEESWPATAGSSAWTCPRSP